MSEFTTTTAEDPKYGKTISLLKDEKRVFSCGLKKAQAILANIEAIKAFVEANKSEENDGE